MNDDALPLGHELASSYLDNEVDAIERAQVDGSPELTDLVATFRSIGTRVGDVGPLPASAREAALTAAMAEFDAPAAAAPPAARVSSLAERRLRRISMQRRVLSAAAAAVVIGVVGVAVANRSTDDKSSTTRVAESQADGAPLEATGAPPADTTPADAARPTIAVIGGAADVAQLISTPAELLSLRAAMDEGLPSVAASTTTPADDVTAEKNQAFGTECTHDGLEWLADIIYIDVPAIAVVDPITGRIQAIDAYSCNVLAEVSP